MAATELLADQGQKIQIGRHNQDRILFYIRLSLYPWSEGVSGNHEPCYYSELSATALGFKLKAQNYKP